MKHRTGRFSVVIAVAFVLLAIKRTTSSFLVTRLRDMRTSTTIGTIIAMRPTLFLYPVS